MFDLEEHIRSWRQTLLFTHAVAPPVVDELEGHLREDVERLVAAGQTPEQAWGAAVARLGDPAKLAEEFAKEPPGAWLPARVSAGVLVACALLLGAFLASRLAEARVGLLLACHVFAITVGYLATAAVGASAMAAVVARAIGRFGPREAEAFRRLGARVTMAAVALTLAGIVLGAIWSSGHLGAYWTWDAREVGGLCVLVWTCAVLTCLRQRALSVTSAMMAALVGNVVVALAWVGPALVATWSVEAWYAPVVGGFVIAQLACVFVMLQPPGWLTVRRRPV